MLSESEGCAVLRRVFSSRGYAIAEHAPFAEAGVACSLDGWDAAARVGYEYLTHQDADHLDFPPAVIAELEARMEAGELYVFLIDQVGEISADDLATAAGAFLDEVARRRGGQAS